MLNDDPDDPVLVRPWWWLVWLATATLAFIGLAALFRWWGTTLWALAAPVVIMLVVLALGARRTASPDGAHGLVTQAARSAGRLEVPQHVDRVPALVEEAAGGVRALELTSSSAATARLEAGVSWGSWGERITLRYRPAPGGGTEIVARCDPAFWLTVHDHGRGAADLEQLLDGIERAAAAEAARA